MYSMKGRKNQSQFDDNEQLRLDTVAKLFMIKCEQWGDKKVCMRHKQYGIWNRYTWKDVYENVKSFSLGLQSLGIEPGDRVGVVTENSPAYFWTCYSVQAAKAIVAWALPDSSTTELKHIMSNADVKFIVAEDQEQVDKLLDIKDELCNLKCIIYWDCKGMWGYSEPILMSFKQIQELGKEFGKLHPELFEQSVKKGKPDDVIILLYSSGTTGLSKGAVITNKMILERAHRIVQAINPPAFMEYLSYLPGFDHDWGMGAGLLVPFIINFPEDPTTIQQNIREIGPGTVIFGSRQWEAFARDVRSKIMDANWLSRGGYWAAMRVSSKVLSTRKEGKHPGLFWLALKWFVHFLIFRPILDNLGLMKTHYAIVAGTMTSPELIDFMHLLGVRLRQLYGASELGVITLHTGDDFDSRSVGRLMPSHTDFGPPLECRIAQGELLLRGGAGIEGYYNLPEGMKDMFLGGWIRTGDSMYMTSDGELVFVDRVSFLRELSTGYTFSPQYIESQLRFCAYIKDAIALGDLEKEYVCALINIDRETVGRRVEQLGIPYSTFSELSQNEMTCRLIMQEIRRLNSNLPNEMKIRRFVNLPKELDPDEEELTRSRKLRREATENRYRQLIKVMYSGESEFLMEIPVQYRDSRTGIVKVTVRVIDVDKG